MTRSPSVAESTKSWRSESRYDRGVSDGANRFVSRIQLSPTLVGATTNAGPSDARSNNTPSVCTVLPNPMSSANTPPTPQRDNLASHR